MPLQTPGRHSPPTEHPPEVGTRAVCWVVSAFRGAQKPQRSAAGCAPERGVKVNAHVGAPRPLSPALASSVSSAHVHSVKAHLRHRGSLAIALFNDIIEKKDWLEPPGRRRGNKHFFWKCNMKLSIQKYMVL